jgi:hypothetical protein
MDFVAQLFETVRDMTAAAQTVGTSPFVYTNAGTGPETVLISGGTVLDISIRRGGGAWMLAGLLAGQYVLAPGDSIQVGFLVKPSITVVPI